MNSLLPTPKSIEISDTTLNPHQWSFIFFPREVEVAAQEILQFFEENWNGITFKPLHNTEDFIDHHGYLFYLGNQNIPKYSISQRIANQPEAYQLTIREDGVYAWSASASGLYYALQSFQQILKKKELYEIEMIDWPDLAWRGVHLDAKGERPEFTRLMDTVKEWSRYKLNLILFEYEDTFPYTKRPEIPGSNAFSMREIQDLQNQARQHFITIIPLIQTLGHAEHVLKHPRNASLRENGEVTQFCSSHDEVFELISDLIHEIAEAHPDSPWIHIGGDEAWYLGSCSDCAEKVRQDGVDRLYIDHMNRVIDIVKRTGKIPIMWDDGLRRLQNPEELKHLDRSCMIHYWDYQTCGNPLNTDWIQCLQSLGFQVMGGSAMRGASGMDSYCPKFQQRYHNAKNWGFTAERFSLLGVIATSWGRYGALKPLIEPFDLGWYGALASAEHYWHASGIEKGEFDQRFAHVFLEESVLQFPKWMKKFEKGLPYQPDWLRELKPGSIVSRNFLSLLDLMWKWQSEEQVISRKLELMEARLYRISEEQFPDWERWRMVDRAFALYDRLESVSTELEYGLKENMDHVWAKEYILSFTQKYKFRLDNVTKALTPITPRDAQNHVNIGLDYG